MSGPNFARALGLGRLAYLLYHVPASRLRTSVRNGGPLAQRATECHRREMEAAADALAALPAFPAAAPLTVHVMTGRRFWYQSVFCLHSLAAAARTPLHVELYDDGSLDDECVERLGRLGPTVRFHRIEELRERLDAHLPAARFPVLRERWDHYPNIRKLIDVHVGGSGWKLVLDSDLLFFRRPDALLDWTAAPDALLHAVDCQDSYGYSRPLLERLAGASLPSRLNVGVCGLRSEALDWDELESWTRKLQHCERSSYYLEQALVAMLAARQHCRVLDENAYRTFPNRDEVRQPTAVMHHYVDTAKRWYFRYGWRHIAAPRRAS